MCLVPWKLCGKPKFRILCFHMFSPLELESIITRNMIKYDQIWSNMIKYVGSNCHRTWGLSMLDQYYISIWQTRPWKTEKATAISLSSKGFRETCRFKTQLLDMTRSWFCINSLSLRTINMACQSLEQGSRHCSHSISLHFDHFGTMFESLSPWRIPVLRWPASSVEKDGTCPILGKQVRVLPIFQ